MKITQRRFQITVTVLFGIMQLLFVAVLIAIIGNTIRHPQRMADPWALLYLLLFLGFPGTFVILGGVLMYWVWKRHSRRTVRESCKLLAFFLWVVVYGFLAHYYDTQLPEVNAHSKNFELVEGIRSLGFFVVPIFCFLLYRYIVDWLYRKLDLPPKPDVGKQM